MSNLEFPRQLVAASFMTGRGGGGRKGAAARYASNGTIHGQSNSVNSPTSSVQSQSASSQNVQQSVQKPQTKIFSKTVRSLQCLNTLGQPPNVWMPKSGNKPK